MLGHSSVAFTMSVYQHVDDEMIDRAAAGLEAAFAH
jgi:integrase